MPGAGQVGRCGDDRGYYGKSDELDEAIGKICDALWEATERGYEALVPRVAAVVTLSGKSIPAP
jgi:hypothetical protein